MEKRKYTHPIVKESTVEELSEKLLKANEELKKVEQQRTQMLENISHDLRAPLTAIRSSIDYLQELAGQPELKKEEVKKVAEILNARSKTLEVLVQDLYYLTCLDDGKQKLHLTKVPLGQFLEEYFFAAEMEEKFADRVLKLEIPEGYDVCVMIDTDQISRVLDNLFTNALKYSDKGATLELGGLVKGEMACFYVRDTGIGISESKLPHIFERTYMAADARTPGKMASSGLGLAIVHSIMEHHHGAVWCQSKVGVGSTFNCVLPIVKKDQE